MDAPDRPSPPVALTAAEAAARLGVSRQTLYAYVSRGLIRARPSQDQRTSRYLAEEVAQLASQRASGRRPREVARSALNWGVPVLSSAITLIADGRLNYRGRDAVALARSASAEEAAALLWDMPVAVAFGTHMPPPPKARAVMADVGAETLLARFAAATSDDPTALWQMDPVKTAEGCGALLRAQAACLLGSVPSDAPIHRQCAEAWKLHKEGAELIRMALVLCADHELNASSFTARCVASTGASLRAAVIGGLAALSGPRHGGMTARIEAFWETLDAASRSEVIVRQRLTGGEGVPGFGHPLYPDGDVRAHALLERILPHHSAWRRWVEEVTALTGQFPNIDLALVALRRHLRLPAGTAFGLFALGRSIGWIAHALEQRADTQLIRPRAVYVGPPPA
ncbi:MAG TPA: citrate synthase [Acetobacteraceae bacterium]